MDTSWDHPRLGTFRYEDPHWERPYPVPAFRAFECLKKVEVRLRFEAFDEKPPLPSEARLAERLLQNQARLVAKVIEALWNDFMGRGPDSGMYWHGNLEEAYAGMELKRPLGSIDLLSSLCPTAITICNLRAKRDNNPVAEIAFRADFEQEHGVGILTDGRKVVGIGYMSDRHLFKKTRTPRKSRK